MVRESGQPHFTMFWDRNSSFVPVLLNRLHQVHWQVQATSSHNVIQCVIICTILLMIGIRTLNLAIHSPLIYAASKALLVDGLQISRFGVCISIA